MTAPVEIKFQISSDALSERQLARACALQVARHVLVSRGLTSAGSADPIDLVNIAMYVESGKDPYELDAVRVSGPYESCRKAEGHGECVLVDEHGAAEYPGQPNTHSTHIDRWAIEEGADL